MLTACEQDQDGASCQQTCMTCTVAVCTVKTPDEGQRNCPKHVEFYSKNKFEKLMHLVGFMTRIYQDTRSPERQNPTHINRTNSHSWLNVILWSEGDRVHFEMPTENSLLFFFLKVWNENVIFSYVKFLSLISCLHLRTRGKGHCNFSSSHFPCCLRDREREREKGCDERLQSHKTEKETGVSIVGLCVVFSFSKSLGQKLQFPLSSVRYGERNMQSGKWGVAVLI